MHAIPPESPAEQATATSSPGAPWSPAAAGGGAHTVAMRGISKAFGSLVANADVDFDVRPGEIHALLGENGAGKTTLTSMLAGLLTPDSGQISVDGVDVSFGSPRDALEYGVGMVQQHSVLVPTLSVAENLVLGHESSWHPRLRRGAIKRWAEELCEQYGTEIDVGATLGTLSVDQVQQVEIVRLLGKDVRILILDEPTAVLAQAHVEQLFDALRRLRERGCSVVIVTHKLSEVMALADRASVLRQGRMVAALKREGFDEDSLATAVVGGELAATEGREPSLAGIGEDTARAAAYGDVVLGVDQLVVAGERHARAVDELSFELRAGEIFGLAGVEGNGQGELIEALAGVRPLAGGQVRVADATMRRVDPRRLDRLGVAIVSGQRRRWDVIPDLTIEENVLLSELVDPAGSYARWGFLRRHKMVAAAKQRMDGFDVRPNDPTRLVGQLSGGNQQRVVLARELAREPRLLIAAYPTHGLDIAAVRFVHQTLLALRDQGTAVLIVSADRDELFALADRAAVLYRGKIRYEASTDAVDLRAWGRAMVGLGTDGAGGSTAATEAVGP